MGSGGIAPSLLTSAIDGGEWSAPLSYRFTPPPPPGDKALSTHCIGGWVDPRVGLDANEKRKIFFPAMNETPIPI
jgi:hypothetical protein